MRKKSKTLYGLLLMLLGVILCVQPAYAGELKEETVHVELLREGALVDVNYEAMDVLQSGEVAWESGLREALKEAFDRFQTSLDVTDMKIAYNEENRAKLIEIYRDVINSDGKYFYLSGGLNMRHYSNGDFVEIMFYFDKDYLDANGKLNVELVKQRQNSYDARVQEILSYMDEDMTDLEKITFLHDFIVRECDYDYQNYLNNTIPEDSYTAYGALVKGMAVCQGYAEALRDLALRVDIPCIIVSSQPMNHAWNMVQLDGDWYHIDATWDDPIWEGYQVCMAGYVGHGYFLLSDEEMLVMEHYAWSQDAPIAGVDGSYAGYIFRNNNNALNYFNDKWYWLKSGKLASGNLDGSQLATGSDSTYFSFMHAQKGIMYLANDTGLYQVTDLDINNIKQVKTWASDADTQNNGLYGFTIINRILVAEFKTANGLKRVLLPKKAHKVAGPEVYELTTWSDPMLVNISKSDSPYELSVTVTDPEILTLNSDMTIEPKAVGQTSIVAKLPGDCLNEEAELVISVNITQIFADVDPKMWYDPFVEYVYENNMMSGKGKDTNGRNLFDPGNKITRAEFVQTLYNKEGKPAVNYEGRFTDVPENAWYMEAVLWAATNGLVSGKKADWFDAGGYITRQEMAVILYKYAQYLKYDTASDADLSQYGDGGKVATWGESAMEWAVSSKIMKGKGSGSDLSQYQLDPSGNATRAETATMIMNFMNAY